MSQAEWFTSNFSERERDRRWQKTREFMQERGLDALLVLGTGALPQASIGVDRYLSNWVSGTVVFPLRDEPVLLVAAMQSMLVLKPETPKEERPWIQDVRTGARGAIIVAVLKEKDLERGHVGVIGTGDFGVSWEGWVAYGTWDRVVKRLPDCKFEDVGAAYGEKVMLVKSEEELVHLRRAAQVLEQAGDAVLKTVRPGVSEHEVLMAMGKAKLDSGFLPHFTQFGSGPNTISPRPFWLSGIGVPRVLQPGDLFITEMMAWSKDLEAQLQLCVAIPPVSSVYAECARLARQSYEEGLRALKPGKTFEEVEAAMHASLDRPDVWYVTPLIHSLNPMICIGRTGVHFERMPGAENYRQLGTGHARGGGVILEPGMVFAVEPNACIETHRVLIGGNVLVTEDGPEELNELSTAMRVVGET